MFLYSNRAVIESGLQWSRGIGYIFLLFAQYLSNRIIYLMSKKSLNWRTYRFSSYNIHIIRNTLCQLPDSEIFLGQDLIPRYILFINLIKSAKIV